MCASLSLSFNSLSARFCVQQPSRIFFWLCHEHFKPNISKMDLFPCVLYSSKWHHQPPVFKIRNWSILFESFFSLILQNQSITKTYQFSPLKHLLNSSFLSSSIVATFLVQANVISHSMLATAFSLILLSPISLLTPGSPFKYK